jgi:glutathione S-transferase
MITVYGRATSSNVQAVMWAIGEMGLAHERLDYGHVHGGTDTPGFLAMNPNGTVPVIRDGDLVLWESCAILRYLAARYGDGGAFWPADPVARARVDQWAEWGKAELAQEFTVPVFWARIRTAAADRDAAALARGIRHFERRVAVLDRQLAGRVFVAGEAFTLADIVIGNVLYRYFDIDIPREDFPNVAAYYRRLAARPAYRSHVMVSYETLKAEGA